MWSNWSQILDRRGQIFEHFPLLRILLTSLKRKLGPRWCGLVVWVSSSYAPKCGRFHSWSGTSPHCGFNPLLWHIWESTDWCFWHQCFSLSKNKNKINKKEIELLVCKEPDFLDTAKWYFLLKPRRWAFPHSFCWGKAFQKKIYGKSAFSATSSYIIFSNIQGNCSSYSMIIPKLHGHINWGEDGTQPCRMRISRREAWEFIF